MISLCELISRAYPEYSTSEIPEVSVKGLECDSRKIREGFVFLSIKGAKLDGDMFVMEAVKNGAVAVVSESPQNLEMDIPWVRVPNSRQFAARLAAAFYGNPSARLRFVGVTGTNGKTTTTYILEHLLNKMGFGVGVIGTVSYRYPGSEMPALETTPGPLDLQKMFFKMSQAKCGFVMMEVSSHALDQNRVEGVSFDSAIFTNLTRDHLDYHGSLNEYFKAKSKLFTNLPKESTAIINFDDSWGLKLFSLATCQKRTFGLSEGVDFQAINLRYENDGTRFDLLHKNKKHAVDLPLIGVHNVSNALGAIAGFNSLGYPVEEACKFLADFKGVPGRLESVRCGQDFSVVVDFAHTPDGLDNVLRSLKKHQQGKFFLVFGCGGDRDKVKRPQMAAIAANYADKVIVTSDNPRSEDPKAIALEICGGFPECFKNFSVVLDRRKAIRLALLEARRGDLVVLAGKGHEQFQIIGSEKIPFNDRDEAERVLNGR